MKDLAYAVVLTLIATTACSAGSQDVGTNDPNGNVADSVDSFSQVFGTIGGKSFVPKSGFFHLAEDGSVSLLFSDTSDLCTDRANGLIHSGQTLVQFYKLEYDAEKKSYILAPGREDLKIARIGTCETGSVVDSVAGESLIDYHLDESQVVSYTITIDDPTVAPVTGTCRASFQDGSNFRFAFSVPTCGTTDIAPPVTCQ